MGRGAAPSTSKAMDGLRSPEGSYAEDSHRTLDYLGLQDGDTPGGFGEGGSNGDVPLMGAGVAKRGLGRSSSLSMSSAPSMQRLGSTGSLRPSALGAFGQQQSQQTRMRSNTVAAFSRPSLNSNNLTLNGLGGNSSSLFSSSMPVTPGAAGEVYEDPYVAENGSSHHRSTDSGDSTRLLYSSTAQEDATSPSALDSRGPLSPPRARAATIGILDDSREVFMRRRAGTASGMTPHAISMASSLGFAGVEAPNDYPGGAASVMARGMRGLSINQEEVSLVLVSLPRLRLAQSADLSPLADSTGCYLDYSISNTHSRCRHGRQHQQRRLRWHLPHPSRPTADSLPLGGQPRPSHFAR